MTHEQLLKQLFGEDTTFKKQANLQDLRGEHHPQSYVCNDAGEIIGLIARELEGVRSITIPNKWQALAYLNLSDNESLTSLTLPAALSTLSHLDVSDCKLTQLELPDSLEKLKTLDVSRNELAEINLKGEMSLLEVLDVSSNKLQSFQLPSRLEKLRCLFLNNNKIAELKSSSLLPALEMLHLKGNQLPELEYDFFKMLQEDVYINLSDNPLNSQIASNIEDKVSAYAFLKDFFKDREQGAEIDNVYKVMVIGNSRVGKSSLVDKIIGEPFIENRPSTHAIRIEKYENEEEFPYILNLWDFGGQDIYHSTHRFFMEKNVIYLILWKKETETELNGMSREVKRTEGYIDIEHPLTYWVHYAKYFGQDSPFLIVETHAKTKNDCPYEETIRKYYKQNTPNFLRIDSANKHPRQSGLQQLELSLKNSIDEIDKQVQSASAWLNIRNKIWQLQDEINEENKKSIEDPNYTPDISKKTMSREEFVRFVEGVTVSNLDNVLNWLKETGVVYFKKGYFGNKIIIDQGWAIEAVYTIFNPIEKAYLRFQKQKGQFTGADLDEIWSNKDYNTRNRAYSIEEQQIFVQFMLNCELCFELNKEETWKPYLKRTFIAPQLLDEEKTDFVKLLEEQWQKYEQNRVFLQCTYPFLHYGIIQSVIARTHKLAETQSIWRNGIVLEWKGTRAIIEIAAKDKILIQTTEEGIELHFRILQLLIELSEEDFTIAYSLDNQEYHSYDDIKEHPILYKKDGTSIDLRPFRHLLLNEPFINNEALLEAMEKNPKRMREYAAIIGEKGVEQEKFAQKPDEQETKLKVLFLTANPPGVLPLNAENEYSQISKKNLEVRFENAVSVKEISRYVRNAAPQIVHFVVHGESDKSGLALMNDDKSRKEVLKSENMYSTFRRLKKKVPSLSIVFLNACFSDKQALEVSKIEGVYAIGCYDKIRYDAATVFAEGFYSEYLNSGDVKEAVEIGIMDAVTKDADIERYIKLYQNGQELQIT